MTEILLTWSAILVSLTWVRYAKHSARVYVMRAIAAVAGVACIIGSLAITVHVMFWIISPVS